MTWWQNFRRRYLWALPVGAILAIISAIVRPAPPFVLIFSGVGVTLLVFAASYVDFLKRRKHDTFITLEESLKRAKPKLPPLAQLDTSRRIVGVGVSGDLRGRYASIKVFASGDERVGSVAVVGGVLSSTLLFLAKEVPFEDLPRVLQEHGIWVLPQSRYSDELAKSL